MEQKTRTLKDLYDLLWNDIKDRKYISGICSIIKRLPISLEEYNLLMDHFKSQRYLHPEFETELKNWNFKTLDNYWWSYVEDDRPVNRKAFIKKNYINFIKSNYQLV